MKRLVPLVAGVLVSLLSALGHAQEEKAPPSKETIQKAEALTKQLGKQFRDKKYEEAAASCRALIELLPDEPGGHYNLACALALLGKSKEAMTSLARSIELGYPDARHVEQDDDLRSLRDDKQFADLLGRARKNRQKQLASLPYEKGAEVAGVKAVEGTPEDGLRYRLRISEKATPEKPHRLIVWMHPSGSSMNKIVEELSPRLAEKGFALLVFPQKVFLGWSEDDAKQLVEKTLPDVARIKEIDARRPILLGYSAGGQMALELWYAEPDRWGGLVLDAAYPVKQEHGKYVPRELPKKEGIKKVPLLVLVGSKDGGAPLWSKLAPPWRESGVPLTVRHVEGKGHTWLFGKDEVSLLQKWLEDVAAGKLPADPS